MSSKIELLDLHDYALFEIIKKLDHESKLQMMATCKKFEGLIGHTFQFYRNFKIRLDCHRILKFDLKQFSDYYVSCINIQRKIGCLEYTNFNASNWDLEIAMRVVPNAIKIYLGDLRLSIFDFSKLMRSSLEVRELEICGMELIDLFDDFEVLELSHLTNLEITNHSKSLRVFSGFVPSSLKFLKLMGKWFIKDMSFWNSELLAKQRGLEELSLERFDIYYFRFDPKNKRIKKLFIRELRFPYPMAFGRFGDFLKIQESIVELELHFGEEELKKNDYAGSGILTHLLSLKSLKKLDIGCEYSKEIFTVLSKIQLCNPSVQSLTIMNPPVREADLKSLPTFFPNITQFKITWKNFEYPDNKYDHTDEFFLEFFMDLKPINSMEKVVEFEMDYLTVGMIGELELKQLRVLRITEDFGVVEFEEIDREEFGMDPLAHWRIFINSNRQLEVVDMPDCKVSIEYLRILLENLPLLRSLRLKVDHFNYGFLVAADHPGSSKEENLVRYENEQAEIAAQLIAEKYDSLNELMLEVWWIAGQQMTEYLKQYHPKVRVSKKKPEFDDFICEVMK
jgi:hypothetical protein